MSILDYLGKEILYFDGAMGTRLQAAGLKPGELPEVWNITHGEVVTDIHASYVRAGANILKSNTFGANALKMQGSGYSVENVVLAAFDNARRAFASVPEIPEEKKFAALDLGPTGKLLAPYGDLQFEEAVSLYAEIVRAGVKAGADLVLIETMSDTYEARAAILAAKENSSLPVFVTFTFDKDGKLLNGADVETAVLMADGLGVDAVGFNCGLGPDLVAKLPVPAALPLCPSSLTLMLGCRWKRTGKQCSLPDRKSLRIICLMCTGKAARCWGAAAVRIPAISTLWQSGLKA